MIGHKNNEQRIAAINAINEKADEIQDQLQGRKTEGSGKSKVNPVEKKTEGTEEQSVLDPDEVAETVKVAECLEPIRKKKRNQKRKQRKTTKNPPPCETKVNEKVKTDEEFEKFVGELDAFYGKDKIKYTYAGLTFDPTTNEETHQNYLKITEYMTKLQIYKCSLQRMIRKPSKKYKGKPNQDTFKEIIENLLGPLQSINFKHDTLGDEAREQLPQAIEKIQDIKDAYAKVNENKKKDAPPSEQLMQELWQVVGYLSEYVTELSKGYGPEEDDATQE